MVTGSVIVGPKPHRLRGNLPELMRDRTGFLESCAKKYGDFVPLRFGPRRAILINDPQIVADVLVAGSNVYGKPYILRTDRQKVGDERLGNEGDFWRDQRIAEPAFKRSCLMDYGSSMVESTDRMLSTWRDGETRDVLPDMMRLTLQIAGETLFGEDLSEEADDVGNALGLVMDAFVARLSLMFLVPDKFPSRSNLRARRARKLLNDTIDGVISRRRNSGQVKNDLLGLLVQAADRPDGATDQQIRNQAMTFFLAGHETTALTLSWAWYLLAQNPSVESKLMEEIDKVLGGRPPRPDDVAKLVYTERIVTEAMRLYPPLWLMGRIALEDTELAGQRIAKGTLVLISQWVIHRDARWFESPETFNPDRWAGGLAKRLPRYAYFPFGGGPRGCIGSRFAMIEAVLLFATIAQRFRLTLDPSHVVAPVASITLRPKSGVKVKLERRFPKPPATEGSHQELVSASNGVHAGAAQGLRCPMDVH